jgi:hypothetical protein
MRAREFDFAVAAAVFAAAVWFGGFGRMDRVVRCII